jgi:hypothetical protein
MKHGDAILEHLKKRGYLLGAEIGVNKGELSKHLMKNRPALNMILVDRWTAYSEEEREAAGRTPMTMRSAEWFKISKNLMTENLRPFKKRYLILNGDSVKMADQVKDGSLDFVFIDADHSYQGCLADIKAWAPKVKPGGLISGHDYESPEHPGVKQAVDEVCGQVKTGPGRTWFVRKPK